MSVADRLSHMDENRARELLAAERERIERDLADLTPPQARDAEEADELDPADRGRDLYEDELEDSRRQASWSSWTRWGERSGASRTELTAGRF